MSEPYFVHLRPTTDGRGEEQASRWAATVAFIIDPESRAVYTGVSLCSPKDHFNRKRGREIAPGRAMSTAGYKWNLRNRSFEEYYGLACRATQIFAENTLQDACDVVEITRELCEGNHAGA